MTDDRKQLANSMSCKAWVSLCPGVDRLSDADNTLAAMIPRAEKYWKARAEQFDEGSFAGDSARSALWLLQGLRKRVES